MRRQWLRRTRKSWLLAYGLAAVFVAVYGWSMSFVPGDQGWSVWLFAGALLGSLVALRDAPPLAVASWQNGARGEERTAQELAVLERSG